MTATAQTRISESTHCALVQKPGLQPPASTFSKPVYFYIPEIFDPTQIPGLKGYEQEACWFLHKIITLQSYYKHQNNVEWVNISKQTIRQFIHPSAASLVRSILLNNKIIECNNHYTIGVHSMGYRLAQPYQGEVRRVEITKQSLIAKMLKHRIKYHDAPIPEEKLSAVHTYLLSWLRKLKIDTTRAYTLLDARKCKGSKRRAKKIYPRSRVRMTKAYRRAIDRMTVDQIDNGQFDFTICKQGRVHTPLTRLFTEARSCLSIDGKQLAGVDIANSQMIFFTLLLLESEYDKVIGKEHGELMELDVMKCKGDDVPPPSLCRSSLRGTKASCLERFVGMVMDGSIYPYLMQKLDWVDSRGEFKRLFFQQVLYGDNDKFYASSTPLANLFRSEFPEVWDFMIAQKFHDFKQLSIRMQQRESRYLIGQVCSRLMTYHPEIPVLTVHDSIMTHPEHLPTVKRILLEEFSRLGVHPTVRVEQ